MYPSFEMDAKYLLSHEKVNEIILFVCFSKDAIKFPSSKFQSKIFLCFFYFNKKEYLSIDPDTRSLPSEEKVNVSISLRWPFNSK